MTILKGNYKKKDNTMRLVEVVELLRTPESIEGIDLLSLNEEEKIEFIKIMKEHEEKMKPFIAKAWRKFLPGSFVGAPNIDYK